MATEAVDDVFASGPHQDPAVFINYRATDEPWAAILLDHILVDRFGSAKIFLDSRSIPPGEPYPGVLLAAVRRSSVLVAVIGIRWLADFDGEREWTRREIAEALVCRVSILPVLVGELPPLRSEDLPGDIAALAWCQYLRLRTRDAYHDLARIVETIVQLEPALESPRPNHQVSSSRRKGK